MPDASKEQAREANRIAVARYREKNRKKVNASARKISPEVRKDRKLRSLYGISLKQFNEALEKQKGICLVCYGEMKKPFVDHCHKTGRARGLLCAHCNFGLGNFRDDPEILKRAIRYLKVRGRT